MTPHWPEIDAVSTPPSSHKIFFCYRKHFAFALCRVSQLFGPLKLVDPQDSLRGLSETRLAWRVFLSIVVYRVHVDSEARGMGFPLFPFVEHSNVTTAL